ncbi:MAG: IS110 family transposase [Gammaproteobacteria bacterium]|nr:IS110 family transposase [Gammaproteobacteria bacterium]
MKITTIGLDIAKSVFHLFAVNKMGRFVKKKQLRRKQVLATMAKIEPCLIVMEACGGAHYWAREFIALGHQVKLIAPQYVKPYVKGNKNDYNDAEAIAEAAQRPSMRFVPIKSVERQDVQNVHCQRERIKKERTALVNQVRGLLAEYGVVINKGIGAVRRDLPEILEDADNGLTALARACFAELLEELRVLDERFAQCEQRIKLMNQDNEICQRLDEILGIGPVIASATYAAAGDGKDFVNGRHFSAWLGLVPGQHSSGGKTVLLGISKRGNVYLRTLFIHGARAVLRHSANKTDRFSRWAQAILVRRGHNKACVAVANKMARMAWVIMAKGETYRVAT